MVRRAPHIKCAGASPRERRNRPAGRSDLRAKRRISARAEEPPPLPEDYRIGEAHLRASGGTD